MVSDYRSCFYSNVNSSVEDSREDVRKEHKAAAAVSADNGSAESVFRQYGRGLLAVEIPQADLGRSKHQRVYDYPHCPAACGKLAADVHNVADHSHGRNRETPLAAEKAEIPRA